MWTDTPCVQALNNAMSAQRNSSEESRERMLRLRLAFSPDLAATNAAQWAKAVDIGRQAWSNYESLGWRPRLDEAMKLVAKTSVTLDWIYRGERGGVSAQVLSKLDAINLEEPKKRA